MIRILIPDSDPILHAPAKPFRLDVSHEALLDLRSDIDDLTEDLWDTVIHHDALGLAAPQIGVAEQMFVIRTPRKKLLCINPTLISQTEESALFGEGCLSYPGQIIAVRRPIRIKVGYHDQSLTRRSHYLNDLEARVWLHEFQHLQGITMFDVAAQQTAEALLGG